MNKDFVSELNLWCQKNKKPSPIFTDQRHGEQSWVVKANFLDKEYTSAVYNNKKIAKQDVAEKIFTFLNLSKPKEYTLNIPPHSAVIIDGDQRADCWRFINSSSTNFPHETKVYVYIGPSTPEIKSEKPNITVIRVASPSRDAADARILMDLGAFIERDAYEQYYLISSDHILVQAAIDTPNVTSIANLADLTANYKGADP